MDEPGSPKYTSGMRQGVPSALRVAMCVSGVLAVWGMDQGVFWLGATFKPLTTLLLFAVLGRVNTPLRRMVALGLVFSLIGDVVLLGKTGIWFQLGLAAFLGTHVCYVVALRPYWVRQARTLVVGALALAASVATVGLSSAEAAKAGVAVPVAVYAAAITVTVVVASATLGSRLRRPLAATLGAALFYVADTCIAIDVFVPWLSLPHPAVFTTGVYWLGQYGIVVAARAGVKHED